MSCQTESSQWGRRDGGTEAEQLTDLQQQDELREALDGLDHQTVQGDPVWTGRLLLLKVQHNHVRNQTAPP